MKLSEAMASLTPEQREAVEARFEALKIELAHAEGAAIIATDRPNEEFNERLAEMNAALRARVAELEERLDAMMPLFEEARDALPAITLGSAKLRGIRLDLADRMDDVGDPERWAARKSASAASADIDAARAAEAKK